MRKLTKLLALTLAVVMLLPATALAADNSAEDGPKLVMYWLDWDDEGRCYANDDVLKAEGGWAEDLHFDPTRGDHVIFFVVDGDKRTPVVPTGDGNINVIKVDKDGIKSGAKQSASYVRLEMKEFKDGVLTAKYSGKELTFPVIADLPDVGFYSAPEAKPENLLTDGMDPAQLKDLTAYFLLIGSDETHGRHVTDVKKSTTNGTPSRWELEQVDDTTWKITLKADQDWIGVNLDVSFADAEGNAYTEDRGIGFETPHGPELWNKWLDWNEDGLYLRDDADQGCGFNIVPGDECNMAFYTCDYDEDGTPKLTPVTPDKLTASKGITLTSLKDESTDKMAEYFVRVTVDDWNMEGTISCGDYSAPVTSYLPDFGIYSKPELTTDSFLINWYFSPTVPNETVYIGSYIPEGDDRFLADLKLAKFENSDQFTLEKYNEDFYKLTRKSLDVADMTVEFEGAWGWADGHTEPMQQGIWLESLPVLLAGDSAPEVIDRNNPTKYTEWKDKVSDKLTLAAGESKDFQVCFTFFTDVNGTWTMGRTSAGILRANNSNLKITTDDTDYAKMTLSCDTPGTYTLSAHSIYPDFKAIYHADGTKYTAEELREFNENNGWELTRDMKQVIIYNDEHETGVLFEEAFPGERAEFEVVDEEMPWYPITVTVTGEAPRPAFTDVKTGDWFAPAVSYANSKGYMNGSSATSFNPTGRIKGSEFAQILYNKEGKPAAAEGAAFQGVTDQWYAPAILWAAGKGIVADTGDAAVVPTADLTREQIALMLYNYMGKPEAKGDLTAFTDAAKVSAWAKDAMAWAVGEGVLKGSDNALNPTGTATRAETAQILMNFFK